MKIDGNFLVYSVCDLLCNSCSTRRTPAFTNGSRVREHSQLWVQNFIGVSRHISLPLSINVSILYEFRDRY